jgi:1-acyl-sn-glycerol-3-phosphate acyltransferase
MDIPFLGHAIGWHNYKFIAKKELEKVPILGKAIKCGKNVLVDRTNRKSQLMTLKQGIKWLDVSFFHRPSVRPSVGRTVSKMRAPNFVLSFDLLCFIYICRRYENRTYRVIIFLLPDRGR